MNSLNPSSSLTDEEIEAFLATRPPWREKDCLDESKEGMEEEEEGEGDDIDLTELLGNQHWPSHVGMDTIDGMMATLDQKQQRITRSKDQIQERPFSQQLNPNNDPELTPSMSMPSAFAAQFMSGTPEQDMLLRALAEQQEQQKRQSMQSSDLQNGPMESPNLTQTIQSAQPSFAHIQDHAISSQCSPIVGSLSSQFSNLGYDQQSSFHQFPAIRPIFNSALPSHSLAQPSWSQSPLVQQQQINLQLSPNQPFASNDAMMQHKQTANVGSPHSEVFSSPEERIRQLVYNTPSRTSHSSLQSVQEHDVQSYPNQSALSSPAGEILPSRRSTISTHSQSFNTEPIEQRKNDPLQGLVRRGSDEITALRQRRQVRRTYTGPSAMSSFYSPTTSFINSAGNLRLLGDPKDGMTMKESPTTIAPSGPLSHQSPVVDDTTGSTLSPSDYKQRISDMSPASIPPSLSAELAGLGLDVSKFYKENYPDLDRDGSFDEGLVMHDEDHDISMQRTSSSSSDATTKIPSDVGEQSLFSQNTTFSSGLDDSIFSVNDPNSSRWVHGRDTPPSTPPKNIILRPSSSESEEQPYNTKREIPMNNATKQINKSNDFLRPDIQRYTGSDTAQTWPRRLSNPSSSSGSGTIDFSSTQSHSSQLTGADASDMLSHSPIYHSRSSENPRLNARLSPQLRLVRTPSSSSSNYSMQHGRELTSAVSTIAAASAASGSSGVRRSRPSSRIFTQLEAANLSVESLRSENLSHSRSSRLRGGSSGNMGMDLGNKGVERNKRWSTSFINIPPSFDLTSGTTSSARIRRTGQGRRSEPDQYEQVSAALETLRTFLRQRGGGGGAGKKPNAITPTRSISSQLSSVTTTTATSASLTARSDEKSSSQSPSIGMNASVSQLSHAPSPQQNIISPNLFTSDQQKVLRHPPPGPLPPRGSLNHGIESMQTPSRSASSHSISPVASFNVSPHATMTPNSKVLERTNTTSTSSFDSLASQRQRLQRQQRHQHSTSSASIDKVAVLEDLADRIRRMRDEDHLMSSREEQGGHHLMEDDEP